MKNYIFKTPLHRWHITWLLVGIIVSAYLTVVGHEPLLGKTPPKIMLIIFVLVLLTEWKTFYVSADKLCERYNLVLFRRIVCIDRIKSVEILVKKQEYILLVALDDCPSFKNSKRSNWESYAIRHPIKVIGLPCSKEKAFECLAYFREQGIHTEVIYKGSRNPDLR